MKISTSGKFFRRLRKLNRINQVDFSKRVGISQSALSKYEHGLMEIPSSVLIKMLHVFGLKMYLVKE